jgi:hypothetical protein
MRHLFPSFILMVMCVAVAAPCRAQTSDARKCETDADRRGAAWAAASHSWLASVWELETREIALDWCRTQASAGDQMLHNVENLGRVLFTGEGVHPVVGTIAPQNGFAGGVALNHSSASASKPLRFDTSVEGRGSLNGSWNVGTVLSIRGSSPKRANHHARAAFDVEHSHVRQLSYFGVGNGTPADETRFGLDRTLGRLTIESAATKGFAVFGQLEGLRATPLSFTGSGAPSVGQRFSDATAPALNQSTTHIVFGGGANWQYPQDETMYGYSTGVAASIRRYQEAAGRAYSFARADVTWANQYTPNTDADLGTFSAAIRLIASSTSGGDRVPFYLQPTLGGTDINGEGGLRSYRDYRFRAPDVLAAQFEYTRAIHDPLGLLLFCDVGKVRQQVRDLGLTDLKHSFGAGVTLRAGNLVFLQLYYAWGGPEGSHTNFSGSSNNLAPSGALRGVF